MLALTTVPPCIVLARDTSALSTRGASAPALIRNSRTAAEIAQFSAPCEPEACARRAALTPRLGSTSHAIDRRYLYVELVTLLS
jgi:hypothetical protein